MKKIFITVCFVVFSLFFVQTAQAEVQPDFYITAEDILNAQANPPEVKFTRKENREIGIMEKRHFSGVNKFDSEKYRIAKLEMYLLGRTWEFLPVSDRMRKLKLASQKKMLMGTAIPVSLSRAGFTPKRIRNDSVTVVDRGDNVGIVDGLLKMASPDAYNAFMKHKNEMYERYGYE